MVADPPKWFRKQLRQRRLAADPGVSTKDAELTQAEIRVAGKLLERTLQWRAIPVYSPEERFVLALLAAYHSRLQRARGKKSLGAEKENAEYRRFHVNLLLRHMVPQRYRDKPGNLGTVMKIVEWLDDIGIEASDPQVRRDIRAALKLGPLANY
jgi:hypothetical protein